MTPYNLLYLNCINRSQNKQLTCTCFVISSEVHFLSPPEASFVLPLFADVCWNHPYYRCPAMTCQDRETIPYTPIQPGNDSGTTVNIQQLLCLCKERLCDTKLLTVYMLVLVCFFDLSAV